jgi:transposase
MAPMMIGVAREYLPSRRDQPMLLPPDVRDWLPADHVVWFLLDAVAAMDTAVLHRRAKLGRSGRAPYDPDMLLALLIYAYAGGVRSSRKIERRCREDAAFMVISGLRYPDHATIARFRQDNDEAMTELFAQVLRLCGRAGMGALEHVAIDGTKIAADASKGMSRDADGLRAVARRLIAEAAAVDEAEDARYGSARGDELPEQLRDPATRRRVLEELVKQAGEDADRARGRARAGKANKAERALALADEAAAATADRHQVGLDRPRARLERAEQRLAEQLARAQAQAADRARREAEAAARGKTLPGTRPVPVEEQVEIGKAVAKVERDRRRVQRAETEVGEKISTRNLTDPDSRFMPVAGGGFILGYNGQLAVSADHLILAVDVVNDPNDANQLGPMLDHLDDAVAVLRQATGNADLTVGTALFDAGYDTNHNLTKPGPDRLIAQGKRTRIAGESPPTSPPTAHAPARDHMAWRLSTLDGRSLYKKRGATVEPLNGITKDRRGLRRFSRRGQAAAQAELTLASLTTNLLRLFTTHGKVVTQTT